MLISIFIDSCSVKNSHSIPRAVLAETSLSDMIRKRSGPHEKAFDSDAGRADARGVPDRVRRRSRITICHSNVSTTRNGYVNGTNGYGGVCITGNVNHNPGYNGAGCQSAVMATGRTVDRQYVRTRDAAKRCAYDSTGLFF